MKMPFLPNGLRVAVKLISLMTLFICLNANATSFSQTITLHVKEKALPEIFKKIEEQTNYHMVYSDQLIRPVKPISISVENMKIGEFLSRILSPANLTYVIDQNNIVIKEAPKTKTASQIQRQLVTVAGTVTDSLNIPLSGVSIVVKNNPKIGTSTNEKGQYLIDLPNQNETLVFSMVGFTSLEIPVGGQERLNVMLGRADDDLEEVVVVAFGTQKKSSMIGAVTSVKPSELKIPASNLTTALAGRVAGIIGFQRSGEPGADNADFFIRGVTTFGYKVDPLILIDNVEVTTTDLARLQVDDIASFNIMKDATATAIFGARGANGVILITTKEGTESAVSLSVRIENSVSKPTSNIELADPVTYMEMYNEAVLTRNPLAAAPFSLEKIDLTRLGVADPILYPTTDWRAALIKDYTMNQRANLSLTGGGKISRYFVSGAFNRDNGILNVPQVSNFNNNVDLKSYSLRSNINIDLTKTTELVVRLNGTFDDYTGPLDGGTKVYRDIMRSNPALFPAYYEPSGNYQYLRHIMFGNYADAAGTFINPYANMVKGYREYSRSMMLAQFELKQKLNFITEGLNFRSLINTTRNAYFSISRQYVPFYYQAQGIDRMNPGQYVYSLLNENTGTEYLDYTSGDKTVNSILYMEAALTYSRTFAEKHIISGLLVSTMRHLLDGTEGNLQRSLPYRNMGLSGRFTYGYDSRYFSEFNFGYNGSERFHESKRFGFFPSVGLGWTISNENFFKPLNDIISTFRLRASYGLVGNDAIGSAADRFYYLSEINMNSSDRAAVFGSNMGYSRTGIIVNRYANQDITWETSFKTNLGFELGLFNRLKILGDFFHEHRKDIFMNRTTIPDQMGLAADIAANMGEVVGKGFDGSLEFNQTLNKDMWLQMMGNFTFARSRYEYYEEPDYSNTPWLSRIGQPLSSTLGYIAERLFIDDEEVAVSPAQTFGVVMGGDIKYRDINGDGQISILDRQFIGKPTVPEINFGFGFSFGYKHFDLSVFLQGLANESFWINTNATAPFNRYVYSGESVPAGTILENQVIKAYADSYWSEEKRDLYALWPRLTTTDNANNSQTSTWFMRDGTFLRLKQLEFGYTLPRSWQDRIKLKNMRIYANGSNLLLWSKFRTWDVEMAGNGLGYPLQKVFNIGLLINL